MRGVPLLVEHNRSQPMIEFAQIVAVFSQGEAGRDDGAGGRAADQVEIVRQHQVGAAKLFA